MLIWLHLLLLFCFIDYRGTAPVRNALKHVTGKRGGDVILLCDFKAREISDIVLTRLSKNILVCQNEECKIENDRVLKTGSCDVIIKDLRLRDAGKYFLKVYYTNDKERQIKEYHLHIQDEISVNTSEELKLDVLLTNAYKVETNSSGEWTEVWTRGHGVRRDRLTDRDGNLTINAFTVNDTGTYRVLDSKNKILITVTVTESNTGSKGKLKHTDDNHKPNGSEQRPVWHWILLVVLLACLCFWVWWFSICSCLMSSRNINFTGLQIIIFSKGSQNKKL